MLGATVAVVVALLAGCAERDRGTAAHDGGTAPADGVAVAVYYVAQTDAGPRLYREFHRVPASDVTDADATAGLGSTALREMFAADRGVDPDYRSFWPAGSALHSPVRHADGVIAVDLTAAAAAGRVDAAVAELTVQQLVYTVQAALGVTDPVRITVEGRPVPRLWDQVETARPVPRADPIEVRSLVQIDNPAHGAVVGPTVTVTGAAATFEATVLWEVLRDAADPVVVRSGFTTAAEGMRFSRYEFTVDGLEPGGYVVRVLEPDPSGGAGRPRFTDTKSVTVRR